jgi:adenylate cyclase
VPPVNTPSLAESATEEALRLWLLDDGVKAPTMAALVEELCVWLAGHDVPIARMHLSLRTIHPEILAYIYTWQQSGSAVFELDRVRRDIAIAPDYDHSPIKRIHDGDMEFRRRLGEDADADIDQFDLLPELRDQGFTDYIILALRFSDGFKNTLSFATQAEGGFTDAQLDLLRGMLPILILLLEVHSNRRTAARLLDTYVGHEAGERILQGDVVRGEGQHIHAVIWYADLRDFTSLSDTRPMEEVIIILDDWFEAMTRAIHNHGGQVLKYIGDGLLAIFPLGDAAFRHYICRQAMHAALEARAAVAALNDERIKLGQPELNYRLALHMGDLMWGNIGAVDRLDFTAIGPSVNLTARLEALCGSLGVNMLVSEEFARVASESFDIVSLGQHFLRGVAEPQEVFALRAEAEALKTQAEAVVD